MVFLCKVLRARTDTTKMLDLIREKLKIHCQAPFRGAEREAFQMICLGQKT